MDEVVRPTGVSKESGYLYYLGKDGNGKKVFLGMVKKKLAEFLNVDNGALFYKDSFLIL